MLSKVWKIDSIQIREQVDVYSNVISLIHWRLSVLDSQMAVVAAQAGVTQLGSPVTGSFVDYSTLTESVLLDWVKTALGADKVAECERYVENMAMDSYGSTIKKVAPAWTGYTFTSMVSLEHKETTVTKGVEITPFTPVSINGGVAPLLFTVVPLLPEGLTMNPTTGEISGTIVQDLTEAMPNYLSLTSPNSRKFTVEIVDANLVAINDQFILTQG